MQSRLMGLSLETLEEYNFSTPNLWKNLQKLTDKSRNRYQAPSSRPSGLKLLKEGQAVPTLDNAHTEYQPEDREVTSTYDYTDIPQEHGGVTNYTGELNESPPFLFNNTDDVVHVHGDGDSLKMWGRRQLTTPLSSPARVDLKKERVSKD